MKVRLSQIEEGNGKPIFTRKGRSNKKKPLIGDVDEGFDSFSEEDLDEGERNRLSKVMINFQDENIIISAWDLHTIEKDMRFVEKPKAHWEYGITINKGLSPSQFINKTDLSMWYKNEEYRDVRFRRMLEILRIEGLNVIDI